MRKLFVICLLMPLLLACGTPRNSMSKEETSTKIEENEEWKADLQKSMDLYAQRSAKEIQDKISEMQLQWNRTNYSAPDSTGKQYPTSTETGTMNNKQKETNNRTEDSSVQYKELEQKIESLNRTLNAYILQSQQMKEKTEPPWWQKALMALGVLSLILIGYRIGKTKRHENNSTT